MPKKTNVSNVESVERRKHWRDRRLSDDRRNPMRLSLVAYDCRTGEARRAADVAGELNEGAVWWSDKGTKYE